MKIARTKMKNNNDLVNMWKKLRNKATITFEEYDELEDYLSKIHLRLDELVKSRDKWREKYLGR